MKIGRIRVLIRGSGRPFYPELRLTKRRSPMFKIFKMMKFDYNIDLFRSWIIFGKFWDSRRSGPYQKKDHFAVCIIFKNRLLICEVREILSKIDSINARFGVRKATRERLEDIQVRNRGFPELRFDPEMVFASGYRHWKGGEKL